MEKDHLAIKKVAKNLRKIWLKIETLGTCSIAVNLCPAGGDMYRGTLTN